MDFTGSVSNRADVIARLFRAEPSTHETRQRKISSTFHI